MNSPIAGSLRCGNGPSDAPVSYAAREPDGELPEERGARGAALIIFYVFNKLGDDAGLTLTGPLF
jgi:hypothetical protein